MQKESEEEIKITQKSFEKVLCPTKWVWAWASCEWNEKDIQCVWYSFFFFWATRKSHNICSGQPTDRPNGRSASQPTSETFQCNVHGIICLFISQICRQYLNLCLNNNIIIFFSPLLARFYAFVRSFQFAFQEFNLKLILIVFRAKSVHVLFLVAKFFFFSWRALVSRQQYKKIFLNKSKSTRASWSQHSFSIGIKKEAFSLAESR